jgi:hypothetical protein
MNQLKKQLICLTALVSATQLFGIAGTVSKVVPRSQSFNAARQMVGWNNPDWGINRYPQDKYYSSFNLTFAYTRTFKADNLARAIFGDDLVCGTCDDFNLNISGSAVPNRAPTDWLADYFGLPRDFQSTITFKPQISNFLLDFSFYAGLDSWIDGLYFRVHAPFVHTKWNLNASESVSQAGTAYNGSYFQGYFSSNTVPTSNLNTQFLNYTNGCVPTINNDFASTDEYTCLTTGGCTALGDITWQSLCCSRITNDCDCDGGALTRNGLAEIRAVLGYNFLNDEEEDYHLGVGIYAAAPTGTSIGDEDCDGSGKGKGRYLFEPIVGNGKHWELGAQVTGHHIWWRNQNDDKSLGLYLEANITHMFAASQVRCFDLSSAGSNSRYMLAQYLNSNRNSVPALSIDVDEPLLEFANIYAPVANITRRNVTTQIAVQGDVAVTLAYQTGNFQWDIGYNFWGRTCEDICIDNCCPNQAIVGNWALKGDQSVYGFASENGSPTGVAVQLAATDSRATINGGSNWLNSIDMTPPTPPSALNEYADNAVLAVTNAPADVFQGPTLAPADTQLFTSLAPVTIEERDFDLTGTRGTSNKVFTNFNWKWNNNSESNWTPYLSLGGELEFGGTETGCEANDCQRPSCNTGCTTSCNTGCTTSCNPCKTNSYPTTTSTFDNSPCSSLPRRAPNTANCIDCAISQWGIWLKVGASYK